MYIIEKYLNTIKANKYRGSTYREALKYYQSKLIIEVVFISKYYQST